MTNKDDKNTEIDDLDSEIEDENIEESDIVIDDTDDENKKESVEERKERIRKNKNKNTVIAIIVAIITFIIVYGGIVLIENLRGNNNETNENTEQKEETFEITDSMKQEMLKIIGITDNNQALCYTQGLLVSKGGSILDYELDYKASLIKYYIINYEDVEKIDGNFTINEEVYNKVAKYYGFSETFEQMMQAVGFFEDNGKYMIGGFGCENGKNIIHKLNYKTKDKVVTITDEASISNSFEEDPLVENITVTYEFVYEDDYFRLREVKLDK